MGNTLNSEPIKKINKNLIIELKIITFKEIFNSIEIIHSDYPKSAFLNYDKFDDIFSCLISDTELIFSQISEKYEGFEENQVDLYESLAAFALFSGENYENKIAFIFRLFDFDCSDTIELTELILSMQCVVRVLCKMANLNYPSSIYLEKLAKNFFKDIDIERSKHIEFQQYFNWINNNHEFLLFLNKYSGTINYVYGKNRIRELNEKFYKVFDEIDWENNLKVNVKELRNKLEPLLIYQDKNYVNFLFEILADSSKIFLIENVIIFFYY